MKIRNFLYTLGLMLMFFASSTFVQASEFNFAVNPIVPENQINKESSYFDLKLAQNQKETLKVQLKNDTDKEIIIEADINSATTNLNGVVEYSKNIIKPDESLTYNIKDYASIEPEIKIPAKTTIKVPIDVNMPDKLFDGVMAGGITFKEKQTEEEPNSEEKGLAIKNEYSYVVALLIRQNEQPVEAKLNLLDVSPGQVNARNVIDIQLQNPVARYINQLKLVGEITKKDDPKVKYTVDVEDLQMAPNSNFSYPVALNGQKLELGNYHLHLCAYGNKNDTGSFSVNSEDGVATKFSNKWEFDKDFSISGEVAEKYNKQDVTIEKEDNSNWLYWIIGLLLLIIAIMILFLIWKRKKKKNDETK